MNVDQIIQHQLTRIEQRQDQGFSDLYEKINENQRATEARMRALEDKNLTKETEEKAAKRHIGYIATAFGLIGGALSTIAGIFIKG